MAHLQGMGRGWVHSGGRRKGKGAESAPGQSSLEAKQHWQKVANGTGGRWEVQAWKRGALGSTVVIDPKLVGHA